MREHRLVNNELGGHVEGSAVQAGSIGTVSAPSTRVNNVFKEVRALNVVPTLYRILASLMALTALGGAQHGGTPLKGLAFACDWLAIPSGWTVPVASWMAGRAELIATVAGLSLSVGLLALPKRRQMGWDIGQALEWRAPSTTVLSSTVLVQCGYLWSALLLVGVLASFGILTIKGDHREDRTEHVMIAVVGISLAVFFAPLYLFVWLFARDPGSAPYTPNDA